VEKVLIVGVAGGQGRLLARKLLQRHEVVGADRDRWENRPPSIPFHQVDIRKRQFEDVFRKESPTVVVHMGFVRHFRGRSEERYDINIRGTRKLLDHCAEHGVRKVIVLSSSYVYGALPENPYFMDENFPLYGDRNYPEIRDLVEVDTLTTGFMWQHPEMQTIVMRPVNRLGYYVESSIRTYLRMRRVIVMVGFNPMVQFIHEEDVSEAISLAVERELRGVFNVAGPGQVPLRTAIAETGGRPLPLPELLARPVITRLHDTGMFPCPPGAIDYIKYPCTISGDRFQEATGFRPTFGLREIFRSIRR
jgi:UDP-glucose 4-epimerase